MSRHVVAATSEIKPGEKKLVTIKGREIGVFNVDGAFFALANRCPHAGHPLNLLLHEFLTADRSLVLCRSHGALFEISTGLCIAGPCAGRHLRRVPIEVVAGYVLLAPGVGSETFAD